MKHEAAYFEENPLKQFAGGHFEYGYDSQNGCKIETWTENNFRLKDELLKKKGAFLEVAGPTVEGFEDIDFDELKRESGKEVIVSNIVRGGHLSHDKKNIIPPFPSEKEIKLQTDSTRLGIADNSLGAFFASGLFWDTAIDTIKEAERVLKEGGLLVLQFCREDAFEFARNNGFKVRQYKKTYNVDDFGHPENIFNVVFEKNGKQKLKPR